jgi:hypothetical protein
MLPNFKWILEILKLRARWRKRAKPSLKIHFLASCSCTLILSCLSKPIHCTPFPLNIYSGRLYVELYEKSFVLPRYYNWDIIKTRQASHGLTETRQKGHWKIMLYQGGGEKNTHTLWYRWTCANGKEWSRGTKEVLVIWLHMVGKMSSDLKSWNFWDS